MFVELKTYRYHGHSMSDPGITYRKREEVQEYRKTQDPILLIRNLLIENSWATEEELKDIDKEIKHKIDEDVEKIKNDPMPEPETLFSDVLHGKQYYMRNCDFPSSKNIDFE